MSPGFSRVGGLKPADERGGGNTAKLGGGSPSQSTTSSTNQELVEVFFPFQRHGSACTTGTAAGES